MYALHTKITNDKRKIHYCDTICTLIKGCLPTRSPWTRGPGGWRAISLFHASKIHNWLFLQSKC